MNFVDFLNYVRSCIMIYVKLVLLDIFNVCKKGILLYRCGVYYNFEVLWDVEV